MPFTDLSQSCWAFTVTPFGRNSRTDGRRSHFASTSNENVLLGGKRRGIVGYLVSFPVSAKYTSSAWQTRPLKSTRNRSRWVGFRDEFAAPDCVLDRAFATIFCQYS